MRTIYFAGGCFWCIASVFDSLNGVSNVTSGYSGGEEENPEYLQVKRQETLHRETIAITFDENIISYNDLLDVFLENTDPFDGEGQYIDRGYSYTLAVYYCNEEEKNMAIAKFKELEEKSRKEVKISIEPFKSFYNAEEEHQDYAKKNPDAFEKELIESGRKMK